jgi:hypothetical protein
MATPPNLVAVPVVTYEYLFCLPLNERSRSPTQWKARGLLSGFGTPSTVDHRLQPNKSRYDSLPSKGKQLGNQILCTRYGLSPPG